MEEDKGAGCHVDGNHVDGSHSTDTTSMADTLMDTTSTAATSTDTMSMPSYINRCHIDVGWTSTTTHVNRCQVAPPILQPQGSAISTR